MKRDIYIPILYETGVELKLLKEVCAGLEEEGVPFVLYPGDGQMNVMELGAKAASMSPLEVGIGAGFQGNLCIHQAKLHPDEPYLIDHISNGRHVGKNAARLVKGLPLQLG